MNKELQIYRDHLLKNFPQLSDCFGDVEAAFTMMCRCAIHQGLIMTCGNGGSAADAEHIAAELMKGFRLQRPLAEEQRETLKNAFPDEGVYLAERLQGAVRAVSLVGQTALLSAIANDTAADMVFAQQVFGYGKPGDLLIALSTSGNSSNVVHACRTAKAFGIGTVGITGESGGMLREICDVTIRVPSCDTYRVQEYHLPIYHALCAAVEVEIFAE